MTAERDLLAALLYDTMDTVQSTRVASRVDAETLADRLIAAGVYLKREPGTYRTPEGGVEVIVDVPESASYLEDESPDEVAYIRADIDVERLARALAKTKHWTPELSADLYGPDTNWLDTPDEWYMTFHDLAAAIAAAYREDAG